MKMHLKARPANEGARKLARWIGRNCHGNLILARHRTRLDEQTIQRLLDGEIIPGEPLAFQVGTLKPASGIARLDWQRSATGGWFDGAAETGDVAEKLAA